MNRDSDAMKDLAFLKGHTIYLRPPVEDDVIDGNWYAWYNDSDVTRFNSHGIFPNTREDQLEYLRASLADTGKLMLAIVASEDDRLLGNISLQDIDLINRRAEIAITLGEERSETAALEAMALLVGHGFRRLNLNRIYGGAHCGLDVWVGMLGALGFRVEGRYEQHFRRDGKYWDTILFRILAEEYFEIEDSAEGGLLRGGPEELFKAAMKSAREYTKSKGR